MPAPTNPNEALSFIVGEAASNKQLPNELVQFAERTVKDALKRAIRAAGPDHVCVAGVPTPEGMETYVVKPCGAVLYQGARDLPLSRAVGDSNVRRTTLDVLPLDVLNRIFLAASTTTPNHLSGCHDLARLPPMRAALQEAVAAEFRDQGTSHRPRQRG